MSIAKRVTWFSEPAEAVERTDVFLAHVMTYGTIKDVVVALEVFGLEAFREALDRAGPGIFDARTWAFWNLKCGRPQTPPMPVREYKERRAP